MRACVSFASPAPRRSAGPLGFLSNRHLSTLLLSAHFSLRARCCVAFSMAGAGRCVIALSSSCSRPSPPAFGGSCAETSHDANHINLHSQPRKRHNSTDTCTASPANKAHRLACKQSAPPRLQTKRTASPANKALPDLTTRTVFARCHLR